MARPGTALAELSARHEDLDIVVLDYSMPGMNGIEILREIRRDYPALRVILSSGYMMEAGQDDDAAAAGAYLDKPYTSSKLKDVMARVATPSRN